MRRAFGLGVLLLASRCWAQSSAIRCAEPPRWEDFSAIVLTVQTTARGFPDGQSMTVDQKTYDDGVRIVSTLGSKAEEIIWLDTPQGNVAVSSKSDGPVQLGEVSMVYELPLMALKQRFQGPCALQARIRYPAAFGDAEDSVKGDFELEGDVIRFTLLEQRRDDRIAYSGSVRYELPRGKIPADIAIRGWTVFRRSMLPDKGVPSTFATLGEFQDSLRAR